MHFVIKTPLDGGQWYVLAETTSAEVVGAILSALLRAGKDGPRQVLVEVVTTY